MSARRTAFHLAGATLAAALLFTLGLYTARHQSQLELAQRDERIAGLRAEMDKVQGFPLKRITVTHMHDATGAELDVHLKLIAIPDYEAALRSASDVDFRGIRVPVLELPALYAAKRAGRIRARGGISAGPCIT